MTPKSFFRASGCALCLGGALTFLLNAVLTPLFPKGVSFAMVVISPVFLGREISAAFAAMFLLFASVGLYLRQAKKASWFGALAFALAFVGSALLVGIEWNQIFDTRDLALRAPATLNALNAVHGMSLTNLGALMVYSTFTIGWIAFAAWTMHVGILPRAAATLVIAGFCLIPLLKMTLPGLWGPILGNGVLGAGWFWLGMSVFRHQSDMTMI